MTDTLYADIDTQLDFVDQDGKLPVPGAEEIRDNLRILTDHAMAEDIKQIKTADWHNGDTEEIAFNGEPDFEDTFPPHCMANSRGAKFIDETKGAFPYIISWMDYSFDKTMVESVRVVELRKDKFNVFEGNPFADEVLDLIDPDEIITYGVSGDVCVAEAVQGFVSRGYDVKVVEDAIASLDEAPKDMWRKAGVELVETEQVVR